MKLRYKVGNGSKKKCRVNCENSEDTGFPLRFYTTVNGGNPQNVLLNGGNFPLFYIEEILHSYKSLLD